MSFVGAQTPELRTLLADIKRADTEQLASEMRDFLDAIKNDPRLFTTIVMPSSEGMSVSVKIK